MKPFNNNRLGLYYYSDLKKIEYYLFNTKYHIIDESFTFNCETLFDVEYLKRLHIFLFGEIYGEENCTVKESLIEEANKILFEIKEMLDFNDTENLGKQIYKLWEYQIFVDGNTRTILCYLKVLSKIYNFKMDYDFSKDVTEDYFIDKVIDSIESKKIF